MPFLDDSGVRLEDHRGPLWSALALFGTQPERLIAINLIWSIPLLPGMAGMAFHEFPMWLRVLLIGFSGLMIVPATATLYRLVMFTSQQVPTDLISITATFGDMFWPAFRTLLPLYSTVGLLAWSARLAGASGLIIMDILLQVALLFSLLCANYWGVLLAGDPKASPRTVLHQSVLLVWRSTIASLLLSGLVLITAILGAVSIGGLFLAVPVIIALLQTRMLAHLHNDERYGAHGTY